MAQSDTVERILDAAEALFAEKGFAETSLRTITSQAGVNLAAVNYHFGSKKVLIQAVFTRFLDSFVAGIEAELDHYESSGMTPGLEKLVALLGQGAMKVKPRGENDIKVFMKLLALAFNQTQGHLRHHLKQTYGSVFSRYMQLVMDAAPDLPMQELYWRINFMMGSVIFTMSGFDALNAISDEDYGVTTTVEDTLHRLGPFLVSGMRAPKDMDFSTKD
ncbi:TetR family transcriptional regulator [Sansalvadorimonas sp. 2012CJ34-2]|uniref:TetR family transcriptional regulator n=1 Tax=Parendozoicomonas callyspongiae TaxID=2942213 RepID=A0ABT0PH21_9GAMM|nr:TetR/AcrR family transcriptional regulator [Sansalvadorimonas sp. 2012CJ34-2]MCL6269803.1 TetR family transcriptional regulator [Sansalvadorimonas sp. 2012CJ34-2]